MTLHSSFNCMSVMQCQRWQSTVAVLFRRNTMKICVCLIDHFEKVMTSLKHFFLALLNVAMFIAEHNLWLSNYLHITQACLPCNMFGRSSKESNYHSMSYFIVITFALLCFFCHRRSVFFSSSGVNCISCVWNNMPLIHIVSLVLRNRCCSDLNGSQKILRILKRQSNRTKIGQRLLL